MNKGDKIELRSEEFQEVLGRVPSWILRWGISVLAVIIAILLTGSAIIKYPDVIPAQIVLTGSTPPAAIVAHASGKIKHLYVNDNQEIKTGDYLAVIDNPARTEDVLTLKNYLSVPDMKKLSSFPLPEKELHVGNLQSNYADLCSLLFEYREMNRLLYYPQKMEMTQERIARYEEQYDNLLRQQKLQEEQFLLIQKQFQRDSSLNQKGGVSMKEVENSKSQYLQGLISRENMFSTLNNMRIQIAQLKESLIDTEYQHKEKTNDLHSRIQSLILQLKTGIQEWELNYVLRAPIGGKIAFTRYWIENQNVSSGEEVFTIVPTAVHTPFPVIGKAMLPIARSGKVKAGQKVNIRLQNFPENEYGILRGIVNKISLVPVQTGETACYAVEVGLPDKLVTVYKKELPYLPNMQGQADIITEDISLLERLVLPVKKILKESI
jgi:HlyD family secretion protein